MTDKFLVLVSLINSKPQMKFAFIYNNVLRYIYKINLISLNLPTAAFYLF